MRDKGVDYPVFWKVNSKRKGAQGRGRRVFRMPVFMLCEEQGGKSARPRRVHARVLLAGPLEREVIAIVVVEQHQWKEMDKEQSKRRDGVMMTSWV